MLSAEQIERDGHFAERAPLQRTSTLYEVTKCHYAGDTGFAEVVIVDNPDYGRMLFLDNELQSTSFDEQIYHENLVHPLMSAMNGVDDKRVLVIGGAEGATVREVLRWSPNKVASVDWVDIDPALVNLCIDHMKFAESAVYSDERVTYHAKNIMDFLPGRGGLYDVIIIDLPDPDPGQDLLYGQEFWQLIRQAGRPGFGVVTHCGPVEPFGHNEGLRFVEEGAGIRGWAYHTFIPSFQGEWSYWMTRQAPHMIGAVPVLPDGLAVVNPDQMRTAFHWDAHWMR